ncbi:hypothetical protein BJV85_000673 [Clostridium acetobutylicum]|uniref:Predicted membrane protein n=1 Tax=Clostridium acetobutylicum (strain ATCC 824 / DSM 792 / JCM 1419 / IAM 19013 / LMG 5710 / NBRC 13948 / NRRL B-527 / VKM B-1787 / 2291 / W) TaxID=272562 RepID=Q97E87_CLOAB|nr:MULTISPECIES: hypothetical protein [Clostridium]AAK81163.1 Predicted membrane protein [Clostridium acetobutylicum ATCC 824]ADZ22268.1 membrane protein [Clostridium acetobutylicum EA 2018]AEI32719.1 hypothetical protein SMB_G3264 [Clostridium acetobutylicum DSM 1731]AWV81169.1 hypothetical protein DK921_13880 [Clostridium acetobutylicum]MBC2395629.1 hypothetical protein [Clostridium acetobutylicum]
MALARIASLPNTTLFKNSGGTGNPYLPNNVAVPVAEPYSGWPNITTNTSPTTGDTEQPIYLWYLPSTNPFLIASGETAYFYRRCIITFPALTTETLINISMKMVADNAFISNVYIMPYIGTAPEYDYSYNQQFYCGKFSPAQSLFETSPYNWQTIKSQSVSISNISPTPIVRNWDSIIIELETEIMNYIASPIGNTLNPAGFQYNIEFDNLPTNSVLTNATNKNPINPLE